MLKNYNKRLIRKIFFLNIIFDCGLTKQINTFHFTKKESYPAKKSQKIDKIK